MSSFDNPPHYGILDGIQQQIDETKRSIRDATAKYQSKLAQLEDTLGDDLSEVLQDQVWTIPGTSEFEAKYLNHRTKGVKDLATMHANLATMRKDLAKLEQQRQELDLDVKADKMTDGEKVLHHMIEDLRLQVTGVVKVRHVDYVFPIYILRVYSAKNVI